MAIGHPISHTTATIRHDVLELSQRHPIVFYDGACGLCQGWVAWLLKRDHREVFYFSRLQGKLAEEFLDADKTLTPMSIVVLHHGHLHHKSDAFLLLLDELGGPWRRFARIHRLVPKWIRDFAYDIVARHRYRWFGRSTSCPLVDHRSRARFLEG